MDESLLALAFKREAELERLADGPVWKPELMDALDVSRSTVDRAVGELSERGLVRRTDEGFEATPVGRVALAAVREAQAAVDAAGEARAVLNDLPDDPEVPPTFLRGATVVEPEAPAPLEALDRVVDHVRTADRVRGLTRSYTSQEHAEVFRDRTVEESLELELVLRDDIAAYCERELFDPEGVVETDHTRLYVHPELPFGLYLVAGDGPETAYLVCYGADGEYAGHLETDSPGGVAWAESVFERYRTESTPYEDWRD